MKNPKDFEDTLNYCLYICYDEDIKIDLQVMSIKYYSGLCTDEDYKSLLKLEKKIQRQFRD